MPFNPQTQDMRAQIAQQGMGAIADYNFKGQADFGAGIGAGLAQAGQSVGAALEQAGQDFAKNKAQRSNNDGVADALRGMGYGNGDFWDKFSKTKDEDKRSGMLAVGAELFQMQQRQQNQVDYLGAQTSAAANLHSYKEATQRPEAAKQPPLRMVQDIMGQVTGYFDPATGAVHNYADEPKPGAGQPPAAATQIPVGRMATNPKTGDRIRWDGKAWVAVP